MIQLKATCACAPPRIIRLSKTTHAQGPIFCNLCAQAFDITEAKQSKVQEEAWTPDYYTLD